MMTQTVGAHRCVCRPGTLGGNGAACTNCPKGRISPYALTNVPFSICKLLRILSCAYAAHMSSYTSAPVDLLCVCGTETAAYPGTDIDYALDMGLYHCPTCPVLTKALVCGFQGHISRRMVLWHARYAA